MLLTVLSLEKGKKKISAFFRNESCQEIKRGGPQARPMLNILYLDNYAQTPIFFSAAAMISRVTSIMSGLTDIEVAPHSTSFSVISG